MIVNLGVSLTSNFSNSQNYIKSKTTHILREVKNLYIQGYNNLRLPILINKINLKDIDRILDEAEACRNTLKNMPVSFSYHMPPWTFEINEINKNEILEYSKQIIKIIEFLGIEKCHFITHLDNEETNYNILTKLQEILRFNLCIENGRTDMLKTLDMCDAIDAPFILDILHNKNNGNYNAEIYSDRIKKSWSKTELTPKYHYSSSTKISKHDGNLSISELIKTSMIYNFSDEVIAMIELNGSRAICTNLKQLIIEKNLNELNPRMQLIL